MQLPRWLAAAMLAASVVVPVPARASVDVAFGAHVDLGNDAELFLGISSRHFNLPAPRVHEAARLFPTPDDLAVALFIAGRSGRSPDVVFSFRKGGVPWHEVGRRCGVPVDAWFVPVTHDPGPPYGRAYGHWRKHRKEPRTRFVLTDVEARDLVAVRMAHEYYGVPVATAMRWRSANRDVRVLMSQEYRRRHPEGRGSHRDDRSGPDRSATGHDKDKGKHREEGRGAKHGRRNVD